MKVRATQTGESSEMMQRVSERDAQQLYCYVEDRCAFNVATVDQGKVGQKRTYGGETGPGEIAECAVYLASDSKIGTASKVYQTREVVVVVMFVVMLSSALVGMWRRKGRKGASSKFNSRLPSHLSSGRSNNRSRAQMFPSTDYIRVGYY